MSKKSASKKEIEMKRFFALLSLLLRNWCWKIFEYIEKLLHPLRAVDRDKNAYGSLPHRILNTSNGFSITHKNAGVTLENVSVMPNVLLIYWSYLWKFDHIKQSQFSLYFFKKIRIICYMNNVSITECPNKFWICQNHKNRKILESLLTF